MIVFLLFNDMNLIKECLGVLHRPKRKIIPSKQLNIDILFNWEKDKKILTKYNGKIWGNVNKNNGIILY